MIRRTLLAVLSTLLLVAMAGNVVGCGSSIGSSGVANEGIYVSALGRVDFLPNLASGIDPQKAVPMDAHAICVDSAGRIYGTRYNSNQIVRVDPRDPGHPVYFPPPNADPTKQVGAPDGIAVDNRGHIYFSNSTLNEIVRMDDMDGSGWVKLSTTYFDPQRGYYVGGAPHGLAVDVAGRIYWASEDNRVYRVDSIGGDNRISIGQGNLPNNETFDTPNDVSVDAAGHIFVADTENGRIVYMDDMTGAHFQTYRGPLGCTLRAPRRISQDSEGRLYILDLGDKKILRIDGINGTNYTASSLQTDYLVGICVVGRPNPVPGPVNGCSSPGPVNGLTPLTGLTQVGGVSGIHVDAAGQIYIANGGLLLRVRDFSGSGGVSFQAGATSVSVDATHVYTAGPSSVIKRMALDGTGLMVFGPNYPTVGLLNKPQGVLSLGGKVFFADTFNNVVNRMDSIDGTGLTQAASCGGNDQPIGLAGDAAAGNLYVAYAGSHIISQQSGGNAGCNNTLGTLGTSGSGVNQFNRPSGVATDSLGRIYIADSGNNRIVRVTDLSGAGWTVLGTQGTGVRQFDYPVAIFVDGAGRIYVGDFGNRRIVRMDDMTGAGWAELKTLTP